MYTEFNVPVIRTVCPETVTEQNCPVRNYLKNNQKLFHMSMNESYLIPHSNNMIRVACGLTKLRKICKKCGKNNSEKTR